MAVSFLSPSLLNENSWCGDAFFIGGREKMRKKLLTLRLSRSYLLSFRSLCYFSSSSSIFPSLGFSLSIVDKKPRRKMMPTNQSLDFDRHHHSHLWLFFLASWFRYWMSLLRSCDGCPRKRKRIEEIEETIVIREIDWNQWSHEDKMISFRFVGDFFQLECHISTQTNEEKTAQRLFRVAALIEIFALLKDTLEKITTKEID